MTEAQILDDKLRAWGKMVEVAYTEGAITLVDAIAWSWMGRDRSPAYIIEHVDAVCEKLLGRPNVWPIEDKQ